MQDNILLRINLFNLYSALYNRCPRLENTLIELSNSFAYPIMIYKTYILFNDNSYIYHSRASSDIDYKIEEAAATTLPVYANELFSYNRYDSDDEITMDLIINSKYYSYIINTSSLPTWYEEEGDARLKVYDDYSELYLTGTYYMAFNYKADSARFCYVKDDGLQTWFDIVLANCFYKLVPKTMINRYVKSYSEIKEIFDEKLTYYLNRGLYRQLEDTNNQKEEVLHKNNVRRASVDNWYYEDVQNNQMQNGRFVLGHYKAYIITSDVFYFFDEYIPDDISDYIETSCTTRECYYDMKYMELIRLEFNILNLEPDDDGWYRLYIEDEDDFKDVYVELPTVLAEKWNCPTWPLPLSELYTKCDPPPYFEGRFDKYFGNYSWNTNSLYLSVNRTNGQQMGHAIEVINYADAASSVASITKSTSKMGMAYSYYYTYKENNKLVYYDFAGVMGNTGVTMITESETTRKFNLTARDKAKDSDLYSNEYPFYVFQNQYDPSNYYVLKSYYPIFFRSFLKPETNTVLCIILL